MGPYVGDVVDVELDPGVLGEALADLGQLLVGRGGEVVPAEIRDLALLAPGRRHAGGEDAGETGPGRGQELTAVVGFPGRLLLGEEADPLQGSGGFAARNMPRLADSTHQRPRAA